MQAIILAAGLGSRLHKVSGGKSKALLEVGGRPLILHQLEMLADHGVGPVLVIVGHQGDEVQQVIGERAEILLNDRFVETNSLYSLWLGRDWVKGPFMLLNCDLLCHPQVLDALLATKGNALAYDSTASRGREQTKVAVKDGRVVDIGKDVPQSGARGESLGILKFDADGGRALMKVADELIRDGREQSWVIEATRAISSQVPITGVNVAGIPWVEIDFPYDLDVARREVWPAIWRGRFARHALGRRMRWVAAAAVGLALIVGGWFASSRVGPASIDWDTVPATGAPAVKLTRPDGTQRWWQLSRGASATAEVGMTPAVIEARAVLTPAAPDSLRFVIGIVIDGKPYDWRVFTATRDSGVSLAKLPVGDRDRYELLLPPGRHMVEVSYVSGHAEHVLVRVRESVRRED